MKQIIRLLNKSLTFIIIGVFIWYMYQNPDLLSAILTTPIIFVVAIIITKVLRTYNSGLFMSRTIEAYGHRIPHAESFYIALLSTMGNFFGPYLGGAGVRAIYLKQKHGLSYTKFASTLSGFYIISFFVNSLLGLVALIMVNLQHSKYSIAVYIVFISWLVSTIMLAEVRNLNWLEKLSHKGPALLTRIIRRLNDIVAGWRTVRENTKLFWNLNKLTFWGFLISMAMAYFEFWAIGVRPSVPGLILYTTLSALALLLSITPGSIGVREAILLFSSSLIGLTNEQVIQISVIDRALTFFVLFAGYLLFKIYNTLSVRQQKS